MTLANIKITKIEGIDFDEIIAFTTDINMATISYAKNGKQRTISIESEAVTCELRA